MKTAVLAGLGLFAFGAVSTAAIAADDPLGTAVAARQSLMKLASFSIAPLGAMAKGEMDYDAEKAKASADNLVALSQINMGGMWPEGSDNAALGKKTAALPVIWETYPKIMEKHDAWAKASTELAAVAGDGLDALKSKIGDVGKSCGGCHDDFRQKSN
jgi:cytochrome c556